MDFQNWKLSVQKWQEIIDNLKNKHKPTNWGNSCGHCKEFRTNHTDCSKCTLANKVCIYNGDITDSQLPYWKTKRYIQQKKYAHALIEAKKVLAAIMEDEPQQTKKWKKT